MISRNPGVSLLWVTRSYAPFQVDNGVLFKLGEPEALEFWAHGRKATREEVDVSVASGLPFLAKAAAKDGEAGKQALARECDRFKTLLDGVFA